MATFILFVLLINSHGGGVEKVRVDSLSACQNQAARLNETIEFGQRYYAFCYDARIDGK